MDLLQLRYFQVVARHQHVSRAAAELRIAQPALSRSIARLEAELGVALFDRRGRRVRLNRFGALFLARVQNALGELDQARQELRDAAGLARGTVAVAVETLRMITQLAAGFLADHPEVSLRLYQSPAPLMSAQLQAGEVDLCLASQPLAGPRLQATEILSEEVLLAVPPCTASPGGLASGSRSWPASPSSRPAPATGSGPSPTGSLTPRASSPRSCARVTSPTPSAR